MDFQPPLFEDVPQPRRPLTQKEKQIESVISELRGQNKLPQAENASITPQQESLIYSVIANSEQSDKERLTPEQYALIQHISPQNIKNYLEFSNIEVTPIENIDNRFPDQNTAQLF
ncbi:TPA: hypothetical protein DEP94_02165 [Candidatus Nomurabacteria bacterium]|nr:hypothetical protein [Candidatus Nomurabacteria bacterium]